MASTKDVNSADPIYQIKITLLGSDPLIWRSIQVAGNTNLRQLHEIIQVAMGWTNSHLYQFHIDGEYYGQPDSEFDSDIKDAVKVRLQSLYKGKKTKFIYEYDFGDGWEHEILLEEKFSPETGVRYPICLKGEKACPPEDCGGIYGYYGLLEIIKDPNNPEYKEMLEWLGEDFDPGAFDIKSINDALH